MRVMALPTEKPLSMGGELYLGRILSVGLFPMTLSTEFPRLGLCRSDAPRGRLMFCRNTVTARATDESVWRGRFDARDLRVTGGTFPRSLRRDRIVRVVARYTGLNRIVENRIDLRKSGRPRRIVGVTEDTEIPAPRGGGLSRGIF